MSKSRPPSLDTIAVCSLLRSLYPFSDVERSSVKELAGYEDRNFYFRGYLEEGNCPGPSSSVQDIAGGSLINFATTLSSRGFDSEGACVSSEFIFKVSHITNSCELLGGINEVMDHLRNKGFKCNFAIADRSGNKISKLSENQLIRGDPNARTGRGAQYSVRVLTYIPGETLEGVQMTSELAYEIGKLAGDMDKALVDFSHPVLNNRTFSCPIWDLRNFLQINPLAISLSLDGTRRQILETTLSNFEKFVLPLVPSFSQGILHSDIMVQNIVQRRDGFGIIDFGDCMRNCHLFELATAIHGFLSRGSDMEGIDVVIHSTAFLVAGYCHAFPLSNQELDCLYYAVLARMCVAAVATEINSRDDPQHSYLVELVQQSWRGAEAFFEHPKEELDKLWTDAIKKTQR